MNLLLPPRLDNENHKEYAYRALWDNIMTLQVLPGTPINEGELSELLKVSRTPIHEAVMKLKDEFLIDVFPQKGSQVSRIDIQILKEGYFLRRVAEPTILLELCGHVPQHSMKLLADELEIQRQYAEEGNVDQFLKHDNQFHHMLYQIAEKPHIWDAVRSMNSHYDRIRYLDAFLNTSNLMDFYQEHWKIYFFLLMGASEEEVNTFYEDHLGEFRKNLQKIMETYPDYFCQPII